ncbi:MAG: methyltransferase domain-containing protein [Phycisphaerales bacterium]|nr:methyltransferase domain-containing protein [Phycisphaerales bacterium]MCB9837119.1 methyltransferase domain-containing protein [Phycisphaera sp.]
MCQACSINVQSAEAFAGKLLGYLNGGAVGLMISVGHRTGLFDVLAAGGPATSHELAERADLNERYVREWLGAMVTGEIVDYDPEIGRYLLPESHAAFLTRSSSPNNLGVAFQFLPVLASVEDGIVDCFRNGGGVPYSSYPRFHTVMAEMSDQTVVSGLVEAILPLVNGMNAKLESGASLLDVGCGRGHAIISLAERFPKSSFTGYDLSEEAISHAKQTAAEKGLKNIKFEMRDLSAFAEPAKYDFVTGFDVVHDQKDPAGLLAGVHTSLKPGGVFLAQDIYGSSFVEQNIGGPLAPFIYTVSCMHCMTVSLAQGGAGLGAAWGKELALEMFETAGFESIDVNTLLHDVMNYFYVCRKSAN